MLQADCDRFQQICCRDEIKRIPKLQPKFFFWRPRKMILKGKKISFCIVIEYLPATTFAQSADPKGSECSYCPHPHRGSPIGRGISPSLESGEQLSLVWTRHLIRFAQARRNLQGGELTFLSVNSGTLAAGADRAARAGGGGDYAMAGAVGVDAAWLRTARRIAGRAGGRRQRPRADPGASRSPS